MEHPAWMGWRFRGDQLVTPGRQAVSARVLEHLVHMHHIRLHYERVGLQAQARAAKEKRSARGGTGLVRVVLVQLADYRRGRGYSA